MANTIIQIKNSGVTGNVPQSLQPGELAINYVDGKIFYGNSTSQSVLFDVITEPAGLNTEIQFNDLGSFGSSASLTYNKSTGLLSASVIKSTQSSGDEGGQIDLSTSATNTTLAGGSVAIDIYQNKLRIFESGGSNRGVYIDIANGASNGVGTDLLAGGAAGSYANSAYLHANSAYEYANALSGGTATDGVARSIANSAYIQANSAFNNSNTAIQSSQSASSYANSAYLQANSAYIQSNTATTNAATADQKAVSAGSYANSAYAQANTGTVLAQAAYDFANTIVSDTQIDPYARNHSNSAYDQANTSNLNAISAGSYANGAFTTANTINTYFYGVNSEQNTNIIIVGSYANSSYNQANSANITAQAAFDVANNALVAGGQIAGSYANSAYLHANASYESQNTTGVYANSAYTQSNLATQYATSSGVYANAAFDAANNSIVYTNNAIANLVNSAPVTLDTLNELAAALGNDPNFATTIATTIGITGSYANSAYLAANTADQKAISAGDYANSAFVEANTANSNATAADGKATTAGLYANSAYIHANSAYEAANNATDTWVRTAANSASSYANSSYSQANTATILAQAAFNQANTNSGSGTLSPSDFFPMGDYGYITDPVEGFGGESILKEFDCKVGPNIYTGYVLNLDFGYLS